MSASKSRPQARDDDRIDVQDEYALCAWARHFNASEQHIKEAVAAVGDRAGQVRERLVAAKRPAPSTDRPSS